MTRTSAFPYTRGPSSVVDEIDKLAPAARSALVTRLDTLAAALNGGAPLAVHDAVDLIAAEVGHAPDLMWLAHSVIAAEMPTDEDMSDLLVRARLGGTWAALTPLLERLHQAQRFPEVQVLTGAVTCDVHTTAQSEFLSGIQRVVRETTARWATGHDVEFVSWANGFSAFRPVRDDEHRRLLGRPSTTTRALSTVVVPWESTHLWVEVITDLRRSARLLALAQHSRNQVGVLGYDSIPITSSLTVAADMTSHFARALAAVRRADRVAMISRAAADEFNGVMAMGAGRRDPGPEVAAVPLAVEAPRATDADLIEAGAGLVFAGMPMVLVVGSHEPRKNHLAVLHAAELLWREGLRFSLVLVGAGSWGADDYERVLASLTQAGRPVQSIRGLPDGLLGAAYRLAHCTVFPSLNEGFGLPVAESLAVGTPVITSDFGSMREIVAPRGTPWGGLLVNPRDDDSVAEALRDNDHRRLDLSKTSIGDGPSRPTDVGRLRRRIVAVPGRRCLARDVSLND